MARRAYLAAPSQFVTILTLALLAAASPAMAGPTLLSAVSRMTHAGNDFDVALPLTGGTGIECRNPANGLKIVLTFDTTVNGGIAGVTAGTAVVHDTTFAGNTMIVTLWGTTTAPAVANLQTITVQVLGVTGGTSGSGSGAATLRTILGDVNASGSVTSTDVAIINSRITGQPVTGATFRADINVDGAITSTDATITKARVGTAVTGGSTSNTAPTINSITDQSVGVSTSGNPTSVGVPVVVGDAQSSPASLTVWATSSDPTVIPNSGLVVTGSGANRTLTVSPAFDTTGLVTITAYVSDGMITSSATFLVTVGSPDKLYVASMLPTPAAGDSFGTGTATLVVNGIQTQGTLRITYNNLTTPKTAWHIHNSNGGGVLFDIDAATPQPDGSYIWTFAPTGGLTIDDIRQLIATGQTYINIHTSKYPSGEIKGSFVLTAGSTTFTPPANPPAIDLSTVNDQDAARFLTQATFGPQPDDTAGSIDTINQLKTLGYNEWFDRHTNPANANYVGQSSLQDLMLQRAADTTLKYNQIFGNNLSEGWWKLALTGKDQLRQRVALALSEILVVSRYESAVHDNPVGLANYHDMLAADAFGNFRTLLKDVTLHPIMGQYLNMRGNKAQLVSTDPRPNENYAREIQQLFSVGLNQLHPDGTLKLDQTGLPIPTYNQTVIENFAKVFTGWLENSVPYTYQGWSATANGGAGGLITYNTYYVKQMVLRTSGNSTGFTESAGNHDFTSKTLLNGYVIPARSSSVDNAKLDLDNALDNIFNHSNVGPFIARRLIQRLVTSKPTPGYVYRVAQKFNDNGSGVRGDLKAVVKAILLDYEARSNTMLTDPQFGKVREPIIRLAQVIRAFHPYSNATGSNILWRLPDVDTDTEQTVYKAPTVFNFFDPDYNVNVTLNNPNNGASYLQQVNAPEMQITNENSTIYIPKIMKKGIIDNAGFQPSTSSGTDVRIDVTAESNLAGVSTTALMDALNRNLMGGTMSADLRQLITDYVNTINVSGNAPETNLRRAKSAIYLVVSSPQFTVQK